MAKEEKEIKNSYETPKKQKKEGSNMLQLFLGIILLGVGLFMLSKRVVVHSSWYNWRIGGFSLGSGTVVIPLIIGIIWYFIDSKSIIPKIIIVLGTIFIVVTIIMSVSINFMATSLFDYILIIGMAAAGTGLLLKNVFKKNED